MYKDFYEKKAEDFDKRSSTASYDGDKRMYKAMAKAYREMSSSYTEKNYVL